jgi:hypothetical protein
MEKIQLLREMLNRNSEVLVLFENLLTAAILMEYVVVVKELEHKKYTYIAVNFIKGKKDIHLDFSFTRKQDLISICTCRGDCNPAGHGEKKSDFIKTIETFKYLLL